MLNVSDKAPDFELKDQENNIVRLSDYKGKYVVLYFYPKDLTEGCTVEACSFRDLNEDIQKEGAAIIGIGGGTIKTKVQFAQKHSLNFPVLQDDDNKVASSYGVYNERSMFGKKFMGIERITYLINPEGEVVFIWDKVNPTNHSKQVLDKLKEFKN